jgi:hypothetical protein
MNTIRQIQFPKTIQFGFLIAFVTAGLIYTGQKILDLRPVPLDGFDFRLIWIAGKLWASGQDPYGQAFSSEYFNAFGPVPDMHFLLYPPYWAFIAAPLSFLSFETACLLWRLFNFALLLLATTLTARVIAGKHAAHFWPVLLVGLGYVTVMQTTASAFWLGQTSVLLYFGFAAIMYGFSTRSRWAFAAGLVAVALKPNVGALVFLVVAILMPEWRRALALTAFVLVALAMPVVVHAPSDTLSELLANLGRYYGSYLPENAPPDIVLSGWVRLRGGDYAQLVANAPENMVGLFHFTDSLPNGLTANVLIVAAAVASIVVFRLAGTTELKFACLVMVVLLFVPLHGYDMVMLGIPAMVLWSRGMADPRTWPALAGLLICLRPSIIDQMLHIKNLLPGGGPAAVGLLLVAIPVLVLAMSKVGVGDFWKGLVLQKSLT